MAMPPYGRVFLNDKILPKQEVVCKMIWYPIRKAFSRREKHIFRLDNPFWQTLPFATAGP
jgi:hypothetical protein